MGRTPLQLQAPEFPTELEYLWDYFLELSSTRPQPITYQEIAAWRDLTDNPITSLDVEVIKRLDRIYLKVVSNGRH
jgi:hypothetical protein